MTTRNVNLSRVPCSAGYEIRSFEIESGARFLLHLLAAQDIERDVGSPQVRTESMELSTQVGGHALALTQMVGFICSRGWSLRECLDLYKQRPKALHSLTYEVEIDANYKYFINTVFREDLRSVRQSFAYTLLGILSFLVPDGIPQDLFEPKNKAGLPKALQFCNDALRWEQFTPNYVQNADILNSFDDASRPLLRLALARKESKNSEERKLILHRLLQREFSFFIEPHERQEMFEYASWLLYRAFPERVAARFMHSRWPECERYIQHVISLLDVWRQGGELQKLHAPLELCYLLSSAAWSVPFCMSISLTCLT